MAQWLEDCIRGVKTDRERHSEELLGLLAKAVLDRYLLETHKMAVGNAILDAILSVRFTSGTLREMPINGDWQKFIDHIDDAVVYVFDQIRNAKEKG